MQHSPNEIKGALFSGLEGGHGFWVFGDGDMIILNYYKLWIIIFIFEFGCEEIVNIAGRLWNKTLFNRSFILLFLSPFARSHTTVVSSIGCSPHSNRSGYSPILPIRSGTSSILSHFRSTNSSMNFHKRSSVFFRARLTQIQAICSRCHNMGIGIRIMGEVTFHASQWSEWSWSGRGGVRCGRRCRIGESRMHSANFAPGFDFCIGCISCERRSWGCYSDSRSSPPHVAMQFGCLPCNFALMVSRSYSFLNSTDFKFVI